MPNGGSDNCGACWYNRMNKSEIEGRPANMFNQSIKWATEGEEAKFQQFRNLPHICTIRDLSIDDGFFTYCANWIYNPQQDELPIGPVLVHNEYGGRSIWKLSPDSEDIRIQLLAHLEQIGESPEPRSYEPGTNPIAVKHQAVIWQLGEFREQRAVEELRRIAESQSEFGPTAPRRAGKNRQKTRCERSK